MSGVGLEITVIHDRLDEPRLGMYGRHGTLRPLLRV